ncbi:MAG: serine hydrolase [Spartobacteria bacterium]|nr:serine hydrolase [Spartobacteria bacterium]
MNPSLWHFVLCLVLAGCAPRGAENATGPSSPEPATSLATRDLAPLREQLLIRLDDAQGQYSVYIEDLAGGTTLGLRPDVSYPAWSLLKIVVLATVLNKIDEGALSIDQAMPAPKTDQSSPPIFAETAPMPEEPTIHDLLVRLICYSDNAASFQLAKLFTAAEFQENLARLGLPQTPPGQPRNALPDISARQFAQALRTLFFSAYLSPELSTFALQLMAASIYGSQIQTGLPPEISVAHMVGFNADSGDFHDCGIIYLPNRPYILCVMSARNTREQSDQVIADLSRLVYQYMTPSP